MRNRRRIAVLVALAGLLASGPASFCLSAETDGMACCDPESRCDFGIRSTSCCDAAPSSATEKRLAAEAPSLRSTPKSMELPAVADPVTETDLHAQVACRAGAPWPPPDRGGTVPLFLLNASILR